MGVDARMYFTEPNALSDSELRELDYKLERTIGPDVFFGRFGEYVCLTRHADIARAIEVHLYGRVYLKDYARGYLLDYLAVADWIERNVAGAHVFYGGDNQETLASFNKSVRDDLYKFWIETGNTTYQRYF